MAMEFSEILSPTLRDKRDDNICRLRRNKERKIDQEHDAEQAKIPIKIEPDSEDEQGKGISTATDQALLTSLKMTCSDNEDPFEDCDNTSHPTERPDIANASVSHALSIISEQITSMAEKITTIEEKTVHIQQAIENVSVRLGRVERKVGISLATLEQVKDSVVITDDEDSRPDDNSYHAAQPRFIFKKISTEEEFTEFDRKLGTDEEYFSNVKTWLLPKLPDSVPDNRMRLALDIVIERRFFAQCSWSGQSKNGPKVCFGTRRNIFKLFGVIGSNKSEPVSESLVHIFFKKKLHHAKELAKKKGIH